MRSNFAPASTDGSVGESLNFPKAEIFSRLVGALKRELGRTWSGDVPEPLVHLELTPHGRRWLAVVPMSDGSVFQRYLILAKGGSLRIQKIRR